MRRAAFQKTVYSHYETNGRHDLPWRNASCTPWHILVSEVMLQQTQVDRVVPKYCAFVNRFPDPASLASASLSELLGYWQGLGYNRRALYLQKAAVTIVTAFAGSVPEAAEDLASLPGIGINTASAIAVYAFNAPLVYVETNIRAVFIHHFFKDTSDVSDVDILPYVAKALDAENPRRWYSALMDYGTFLKKEHKNPAKRSAHHVNQSKFVGSDRQVRGAIIRVLTASGPLSEGLLIEQSGFGMERVSRVIEGLVREGFVVKMRGKWKIA